MEYSEQYRIKVCYYFLFLHGIAEPSYRAGFGDDYGVVGPTGAIGVFGTPHTFDSVVLINLSVGSHIGFWLGVATSAWLTLIIPISNTALEATTTTTTIANNDDAIPIDLIIVFIVSIYHDL